MSDRQMTVPMYRRNYSKEVERKAKSQSPNLNLVRKTCSQTFIPNNLYYCFFSYLFLFNQEKLKLKQNSYCNIIDSLYILYSRECQFSHL